MNGKETAATQLQKNRGKMEREIKKRDSLLLWQETERKRGRQALCTEREKEREKERETDKVLCKHREIKRKKSDI